ncbi:PITH domain-containing protein GA19395 [Drosophila novamexicana]|uniref:PITH domain-containing protein GA19395 n=1 Tax=Drosophila novamexicana TaxID=47314 RepID=UPI0011E5952B|nr:PITH domain-containing protein GA19395 [Drosophila novamexicana]
MPHGHSHGHGHGCSHEATDIDNALEMGIEYSLYTKIDLENTECLNEETDGSGKTVFKPYEKRLDTSKFVQSDADEELLFNIPFTGNIKLKGIIIRGANDNSHPNRVKLFKNRPKMTFDDARGKADQEFELSRDFRAEIEYSPKVVTFSSVHHLSLYFPSNFGDDNTRIYYIGLRGEFTEAHYHGVTICNYEARANAADHKDKVFDGVGRAIQ